MNRVPEDVPKLALQTVEVISIGLSNSFSALSRGLSKKPLHTAPWHIAVRLTYFSDTISKPGPLVQVLRGDIQSHSCRLQNSNLLLGQHLCQMLTDIRAFTQASHQNKSLKIVLDQVSEGGRGTINIRWAYRDPETLVCSLFYLSVDQTLDATQHNAKGLRNMAPLA